MSDNATFFTDIAAKAEIPPNGTLTRVLYKDERLRLVVFAFDAARELAEHTASVPAGYRSSGVAPPDAGN